MLPLHQRRNECLGSVRIRLICAGETRTGQNARNRVVANDQSSKVAAAPGHKASRFNPCPPATVALRPPAPVSATARPRVAAGQATRLTRALASHRRPHSSTHAAPVRVRVQERPPVREALSRGCAHPREVRFPALQSRRPHARAPRVAHLRESEQCTAASPTSPAAPRPAESRHARTPLPRRYPDRIPVICEKEPRSDIPPVDKRKYLIPMDLTVGQFVYVIRKRISIPPEKAIFIFVDNTLPPTAALMSTVYEQHKDEDGFMCAPRRARALASAFFLKRRDALGWSTLHLCPRTPFAHAPFAHAPPPRRAGT